MDFKTTAGCTLLGSSAGVDDITIPELAVWIRGNRDWLYHDNYYAGDPRIVSTDFKSGTWQTLVMIMDADGNAGAPQVEFTCAGVTGISNVDPGGIDVSGDTFRIGGTIHPNMGSAAPAGLAFDNIRIYGPAPPEGLTVDPAAIVIPYRVSSVTSTSSVDVSYVSVTNMDITISISDQTHPDAFSVLSATNQTLTTPSPATTALEFEFDNFEAGLAIGETATGLGLERSGRRNQRTGAGADQRHGGRAAAESASFIHLRSDQYDRRNQGCRLQRYDRQ
jgi:hypothetical protein